MAGICLLVLCGIPGAGKSTWARKFCSYIHEQKTHTSIYKQQSDVLNENGLCNKGDWEGAGEGIRQRKGRETYRVIHIAYDDLISEELEAELIRDAQNHSDGTKSAHWKTCRHAIVRCVEDLVAELSGFSRCPENTTFDCQATYEKNKAPVDEGDIDGRQDFKCSERQRECLVTGDTSVTEVSDRLSQCKLTDDNSNQNCTSLSQIHNYSSSSSSVGFTNDSKDPVVNSENPVVELKQLKRDQNELEELEHDQNAEHISCPDSMGAVLPDCLKSTFDGVVRQQIKGESNSTVRWILVIDDNMYYSSMRYEFYQLARKRGTGFAQVYFPVELTTALQRNQMRKRQVDESVIRDMLNRLECPSEDISWQKYTATWNSEKWDKSCFENVLRLVDEAMSHPVMPVPPDDKTEAVESRSICLTSLLHQADVALRKILGEHIASTKGINKSKPECSQLALSSNLIRKQILDDLRSQILSIPDEMVLETSDDVENPFHSYLRSIFYHRLKSISSKCDNSC